MKKIFFTLVLYIIFFGTTTMAQSRYGLTAGMEFSKYSINYLENAELDLRSGAKIGVLMEYAVTKDFFIAPEIVYAQRGTKGKGVYAGNISFQLLETLNYVQIPVNAMYKFNLGNYSKFTLFAGPYAGLAFSGKSWEKQNINYKEEETGGDITFGSGEDDLYNKFDFGLNLGIGYEYADWFIKVQYNLGLSNMLNNNNEEYSAGNKSQNRNIGISLGYLFY
jgi:hypothetical protein